MRDKSKRYSRIFGETIMFTRHEIVLYYYIKNLHSRVCKHAHVAIVLFVFHSAHVRSRAIKRVSRVKVAT